MKRTLLTTLLALCLAPTGYSSLIAVNYLFNGDTNHAPSGFASQSTTGYGAPASRANDGNTTQGFGNNSTTHTDDLAAGNQFWQVDLGSSKPVTSVNLYNRGEGINNRLSNFRLKVLNGSGVEVWGQDMHTGGSNVGDFEAVPVPTGTFGQIIRVEQLGLNAGGNNVLSLAEVQVMNAKAPLFPNQALTASATQSSTGYGGTADRVNDNNTDGLFGNNSVTHTDDAQPLGNPVWIRLDLASTIQINEIALFNRVDCCGPRLSNYRLSVLSGGVEVWGQDYLNGNPVTGKTVISVHDDAGGFFATGDAVKLELIGGLDGGGANNIHLAEIKIFGAPIPEPASTALLGMLVLGVAARRRR